MLEEFDEVFTTETMTLDAFKKYVEEKSIPRAKVNVNISLPHWGSGYSRDDTRETLWENVLTTDDISMSRYVVKDFEIECPYCYHTGKLKDKRLYGMLYNVMIDDDKDRPGIQFFGAICDCPECGKIFYFLVER